MLQQTARRLPWSCSFMQIREKSKKVMCKLNEVWHAASPRVVFCPGHQHPNNNRMLPMWGMLGMCWNSSMALCTTFSCQPSVPHSSKTQLCSHHEHLHRGCGGGGKGAAYCWWCIHHMCTYHHVYLPSPPSQSDQEVAAEEAKRRIRQLDTTLMSILSNVVVCHME